METIKELSNIIPSQYMPYLLILLPLIGRTYHALKTGGGLRGVWRAIWLGTNSPETKPEDAKN